MKLPHRRQFLHLAAGAAALPTASRFAWAQAYPTRPVRIIEGFGAGSALDIVARFIGQSLSEQLGQSFVIENRSGASSNIAAEAVARASPDGYTLLLIRAGRKYRPGPFSHGGPPVGSGQERSGIHRIREGQSWQDQYGVSRNRSFDPHGGRNVQDDGRR
jgi:Tripartite tricarboxylate transporter family receptor